MHFSFFLLFVFFFFVCLRGEEGKPNIWLQLSYTQNSKFNNNKNLRSGIFVQVKVRESALPSADFPLEKKSAWLQVTTTTTTKCSLCCVPHTIMIIIPENRVCLCHWLKPHHSQSKSCFSFSYSTWHGFWVWSHQQEEHLKPCLPVKLLTW